MQNGDAVNGGRGGGGAVRDEGQVVKLHENMSQGQGSGDLGRGVEMAGQRRGGRPFPLNRQMTLPHTHQPSKVRS